MEYMYINDKADLKLFFNTVYRKCPLNSYNVERPVPSRGLEQRVWLRRGKAVRARILRGRGTCVLSPSCHLPFSINSESCTVIGNIFG